MYPSSLLLGLALSSCLSTLVSAGIPPICLFNLKESCHATAPASCCFLNPGGQMLQTQFWDANPAAGPADHWTIHGLWPDHCDGTFGAYCDPTREYTNISAILTSFGAHSVLSYMETYWPDYHGGDESFWDHEFGKHATCINTLNPSCYYFYTPQQEVVDFFARTVELFKGLNTYKFLAAAGIYPSATQTYTYDAIQMALRRARSVNATFQCSGAGVYLDEMWYTFDVIGSVQTGLFVPVEPVGESSNCRATGIKYMPKNLTSYYTMTPLVTTSTAAPVASMR